MKKVGICGVYGVGPEFSGGQPVKTRMIIDELSQLYGKDQVQIANTHNWRRRPIKLLVDCFKLIRNCQNVIIMPAHNGIKVFVPLFLVLNKLYNKRLHYIVIGGWLPDYLGKFKSLKEGISNFYGIYVETNTMKQKLGSLDINNVYLMNNFKKLNALEEKNINYNHSEPYKLCYFSRVVKEKGVEDAIYAVTKVNEIFGREVYKLDLYGYIDENYKYEFEKLIKEMPPFINYNGVVNPDKSVETIKDYFVQVFPTKYKTEGIPGSIIDSYYAGVPVLASKWDNFEDVIDEGKTGIGFEFLNQKDLELKLREFAIKPQAIVDMKKNCIKKAKEYSTDYVIKKFIKHLK